MLIDIILIFIILLSLFFLFRLLINKLPLVATLDVSQIPQEQQKKVKKEILERKFQKLLKNFKIKNSFLSLKNTLVNKISEIREKILATEKKYLEKEKKLFKNKPLKLQKKIEKLTNKANDFLSNKDYFSAEKKFIEIISLDPRNELAFKSLAEIYLAQKKFEEAKEILKYLIKLTRQSIKWWFQFRSNKDDNLPPDLANQLSTNLINLGSLYQIKGNNEKAQKCFENALELQPNNPKILDLSIEISIILKKKDKSLEYLEKIKEINPENQKIKEWEEKIKKL